MLDKNQITTLVNHFCRMVESNYSPRALKGLKVVLKRGEDYWDLFAIRPDEGFRPRGYELVIDLPDLPEDKMDGLLTLSGMLTERLTAYARIAKANASRTPEARKASAKKAIETRWKNAKRKKEWQ